MGPTSGGVKQGGGGKTSHFLALNVNISKRVGDTAKVTIKNNRQSHMLFVRNFPSAAVLAATFGERPRQAADAAHLLLLAGSQRRCSLDRAGALRVCLRNVEIFDWKD